MPGYDRRGPMGQGAMTGRGLGPCRAAAGNVEDPPRFYGRGFRAGNRGLQRGFRRGFCRFTRPRDLEGAARGSYGSCPGGRKAAPGQTPADLMAEAGELRRRLEAIEKRLAGAEEFGPDAGEA